VRIRALVAALVLPLPFAALPILSLWVGGFGDHSGQDDALTFRLATGPEFVLTDWGTLSDSSTSGDPLQHISYTSDGNVMSLEGGCSGERLVEG